MKQYRNISREPFYANGRMVQHGETTTLPEGCEPGANLEEVVEGVDPAPLDKTTPQPMGSMPKAAKKHNRS